MTPLEIAAAAYEAERHLYRIHHDHESGACIVIRKDVALGSYDNGGAAMFALEDVRRRAAMRAALDALATMELPEKLVTDAAIAGYAVEYDADDYSPSEAEIITLRQIARSTVKAMLTAIADGDDTP